MKVSVVIPAYNEENYLGDCLKRLVSQTIKPDEIIVVDNNCKDKTVDIAKSFGVRIVKEPQQGMIFSRNTGYDSARYEIIARTDADSRPRKDWIARIKNNFEKKKIDCLTGPAEIYDLPLPSPIPCYLMMSGFQLIAGGKILPIGPNHAFTKDIWNTIKPYVCMDDKKVHEDTDLGLTIYRAGGIVEYDYNLVMPISGRRIKNNPLSFFGEYPIRNVRTISLHASKQTISSLPV